MSNASLSQFSVFVSVIVVSVNPCRHALGPSFLHPAPLIAALQKHRKTQMHVDRPHTGSEQDISSVTVPVERMTLMWVRYWTACGEKRLIFFAVMADYATGSFQTSTHPAHLFLQASKMRWTELYPFPTDTAPNTRQFWDGKMLCTCWSQIRS